MAIESQVGEMKPVPNSIPVAQPAPPRPVRAEPNGAGTPRPMAGRPTTANGVPVAQPAPPRPNLAADLEEADQQEELLPPSAIKGWATSIALHAIFLLVLALWFFTPKITDLKAFDTSLDAGSEFGDESGESFKGGLGMDTPLAMPEVPASPALETPVFTSLPASQLHLDPTAVRPSAPVGGSNGGGVNLANPGQGGSGDGFGVARFGHGGEKINGVDVKVGDPQFTLIWDSRADLDIHVLEPGGSHIYWEDRDGSQGGELDVDDVDGFGPENVNWVQGKGPPGEYRWYVHYYGGLGGNSTPTRWKMRLKHAGQVKVYEGKLTFIGEKSRNYSFKMSDGSGDEAPKPKPKDAAEKK